MIVCRNGPRQVLQGRLSELKRSDLRVPEGPALILRDPKTARFADRHLKRLFPRSQVIPFQGESTHAQAERAMHLAIQLNASSLIGVGGGKCLDSSKWAASEAGLPVILIPTSPATCSAWTGVMPVYGENGSYLETHEGPSPDLLLIDHELLATAPKRLVASGMADALAKYYEPRDNRLSGSYPLDTSALALGEQLFRLIAAHGTAAAQGIGGRLSTSRLAAHDAAITLAGLIGEWGGKPYRHGLAHSLYGAWTFIGLTKTYLHGELVGLGLLVELALSGKTASFHQLRNWMRGWGMPLDLPELKVYRTSRSKRLALCRHLAKYEAFVPLTQPFLKNPVNHLDVISRG